MSLDMEKKFILGLISELNESLLTELDPDPNFARTASKPQMYSAFRTGSVEKVVIIGGSNAKKLGAAATTLGIETVLLTTGGWKINPDSVAEILLNVNRAIAALPKSVPIIFFGLDNNSFYSAAEDGSMSLITKSLSDNKYHEASWWWLWTNPSGKHCRHFQP